MASVDVVVTVAMPVPENAIEELANLDPRLHITRITPEQRPYWRTGQGDETAPDARELARLLAEAEIVVSVGDAPRDLFERAPKLRWFHTMSAGIEQYVRAGFLGHDAIVTNGSGPSAVPIAEFVVMMMLMLVKNAQAYVRGQDQQRWQRSPSLELRGKTAGIVGLGTIGSEAARLAHAFGCRVIGMRRSVTEPQHNAQGADLLLPPRELPRLLAESDFVVLAVPSTAETRAIIDAAALREMKSSAFLINIARGSLVDEPALIAALKAGEIAGAALDVFATEPLPADSELWRMQQVIVTPHWPGIGETFIPGQIALLAENLRRYLNGEPLLNVVPPELGY